MSSTLRGIVGEVVRGAGVELAGRADARHGGGIRSTAVARSTALARSRAARRGEAHSASSAVAPTSAAARVHSRRPRSSGGGRRDSQRSDGVGRAAPGSAPGSTSGGRWLARGSQTGFESLIDSSRKRSVRRPRS